MSHSWRHYIHYNTWGTRHLKTHLLVFRQIIQSESSSKTFNFRFSSNKVCSVPLLNLKSNWKTQITVWNATTIHSTRTAQQCPMQQILSTHYLRQKLSVIGVLLFPEPELLFTTRFFSAEAQPSPTATKTSFCLWAERQQKDAECFISTANGYKEEKDKKILRVSVWKHIHLFCLNQKLSTNRQWFNLVPSKPQISSKY